MDDPLQLMDNLDQALTLRSLLPQRSSFGDTVGEISGELRLSFGLNKRLEVFYLTIIFSHFAF